MISKILPRLLCLLLFLPLALSVSVRPVFSAIPSRLAYNTYDSNSAVSSQLVSMPKTIISSFIGLPRCQGKG